jgi:hypothetical protein
MPAIRVKRADGLHCFFCDARVSGAEAVCPVCGREFGEPGPDRPVVPEKGLGERVKLAAGWRKAGRGYGRVLVLLALLGAVLFLVKPRHRPGPVRDMPEAARPDFAILKTTEMPTRGFDRLSLFIRARPDAVREELEAAIDWALFEVLERYNRQMRRSVRTAWLYVVSDESAPAYRWRAMAIWTDPGLGAGARPAGIGGDAVEEDGVEYDFTNPNDSLAGGKE